MNYEQTLEYLFSQLPMFQRVGKAAYNNKFETTTALDNYFDNPHKKFPSIHIAGTNGKGSVAQTLASILQEAGYKVGLYTSPHYKDFRERIKINGQLAEKQFVVDFVEQHKHFFEKLKPSFFEITVSMAFEYFAQNEVDIAVIEVGLGGRLDSTNVITPEISVITNISLDHTQFLGTTIPQITAEKAGIIKTNIPVVLGTENKEVMEIVQKTAQKNCSELYIAPENFKIEAKNGKFQVVKNKKTLFENLEMALLGEFQKVNAITCLQTIDLLHDKYSISDKNILDGFANVVKNTKILGRWQIISKSPTTICDSGHNIEGIKQIVSELSKLEYQNLHIVFGVVNDKSIEQILKLLPQKAIYYFTQANIPRALDSKKLKNQAQNIGLIGNSYKSVKKAFTYAKKNAKKEDLIFVGGSVFVVAEVLP